MTNTIPGRYRDVAVADVDVPLTPTDLRTHFSGKEAYRRTRFIVCRRAGETVVIRVGKEGEDLFAPIREVEVMAGPDETGFVNADAVDTGVPTQMARAARTLAPGKRCVVVQGRYQHINFILEPDPVRIRLVDVVPPEPAKLAHQSQRVLDVTEGIPPVELDLELVDMRDLAERRPAERYVFPCRGSGVVPRSGDVAYLDQRPPDRPALLVGCARSRQIYQWFYGHDPDMVDTCPVPLARKSGRPTLTRCCLLEDRVEQEGLFVTVPWGASLDEVREGLTRLLRAAEPAWAPA